MQRRFVQGQLELAGGELVDCLVGEDEKLAAGEIEPDVRAGLNHVGPHLRERGEAVAADAHEILGGEIQDQVAAVAGRDDEDVGAGPTLENIVALAAVQRLLAGAAGDDVVQRIAERDSACRP